MTMRIMGDAENANANKLPHGLGLVAGYDTGSPDIKWEPATWAKFPDIPHIHIDQGGSGTPVYSANVVDVEPGAYRPGQVPDWIRHCTAPRPTVYCDRSDLPAILDTGWRGDLWLAIPEPEPVLPPEVSGCTVVGVQFRFDVKSAYDLSVIFDPYWPDQPPAKGPRRLVASGVHTVGQIARRESVTVPAMLLTTMRHDDGTPFDIRRILEHTDSVHPVPGTVFWIAD